MINGIGQSYYILIFFFKILANPKLFYVYYRSFLIPITIIQIEISLDGVPGVRTRGHGIEGADTTTELWRPPYLLGFKINKALSLNCKLLYQNQALNL